MSENLKAIHSPRSGFSDWELPAREVTIAGFVFGEFYPGYQRSDTKRGTLAIVFNDKGELFEAELFDLRIVREAPHE
jgi:hypothetical protein